MNRIPPTEFLIFLITFLILFFLYFSLNLFNASSSSFSSSLSLSSSLGIYNLIVSGLMNVLRMSGGKNGISTEVIMALAIFG